MAKSSTIERNKEIVTAIFSGEKTTAQMASRYSLSQTTIKGICRKFSHAVLDPSMGEVALANPKMWVMGQMHAFNPSALITRKGMQIFEEMRKDDQVKAALWFKKLAAVSSGWEIVSPEGKDEFYPPSIFAKKQFDGLVRSIDDIIVEMLTALDFGFSVSEIIFNEIERGQFKGLIGIKDIKTKSPFNIKFKMDQFGNLDKNGVLQRTNDGLKHLPTGKFLIFTYQSEFGNPYGRSDLEACYPRWWIKENAYRWLAILLERFGVPPIFALYDPNSMTPPQVDSLRKAIESIQAATAGAIPRASKDSLEMWAPQLAGQTGRVFIPALEMLNRDISRALLMPGLLGLTPDQGVGSFARARVEFDVFVLMIERLRGQLQDVVNHQLLSPLVDLNFISDEDTHPEFRFLPLTDDLRLEMFKTWISFVEKQVVKSTREDEIHVRKAFGFPKLEVVDDGEDGELPPDGEPAPEDDEIPFRIEVFEPKPSTSEVELVGGKNVVESEKKKRVLKAYRSKTKFEKEVNFKQIEIDLDAIERKAIEKIVPTLIAVRICFLKFVERKFDLDARFVRDLKELRGMPTVGIEVAAFLLEAYNAGSKTMAKELKVSQQAAIKTNAENIYDADVKLYEETPGFKPRDALRSLRAKTFWITGVIDDKIREKSRGVLLRAIQTGEAVPKTMQKLHDVFEPYVGDPTKIRSGVVVSPSRLETIVRTNATDAFNQGRVVEARRAGEFLTGFQYSAIIDSVTTAVCTALDGRIFHPNDPLVDELRPPRHHNCFIDGRVKVFTAKGWVSIRKIEVGDLVLTHRGRFRPVTFVHHRQAPKSYRGLVVDTLLKNLNVSGGIRPLRLTMTPDHPILTDHGWVPVTDLVSGDKIKVLARLCPQCHEEFPWIYLPEVGESSICCSKSCKMKHLWSFRSSSDRKGISVKIVKTRRANDSYTHTESQREKIKASWTPERKKRQASLTSKQVKLEYANGTRDAIKVMKKVRRKIAERYARGEGPFNDPKIRKMGEVARKKSKKWWKSITIDRMGDKNPIHRASKKKLSEAGRRRYRENPDSHPNRIMGRAVMKGHEGYLSKGQRQLFELARNLDRRVKTELEYPVNCKTRTFYVDVAFPHRKLGLEFDGSYWHKDNAKDAARDKLLLRQGWNILRYRDAVPTKDGLQADIERVLANHREQYKFTMLVVDWVKQRQLKKARQLFNLSVADDESYIANGVMVHNCRSILTAVSIDEPVEEKDFITDEQAGEALGLSGEDFGGPPRATGQRRDLTADDEVHIYIIQKRGSEWCVVSEDGTKKLGCYPTEKQARERLRQIEAAKAVKNK